MPQNTKTAIMESFAKLASRIPIDKITVKDVVDNCNVNRNTFYYYFQDIYALVEEFFTAGIESQTAGEFENTWISGFVRAARFIKENPRVIRNVYISVGRDTFESFLNAAVCLPVIAEVDELTSGQPITDTKRQTVAEFYGEALLGILCSWIRKDMKRDVDGMAREIFDAFGQGIADAVSDLAKQNY